MSLNKHQKKTERYLKKFAKNHVDYATGKQKFADRIIKRRILINVLFCIFFFIVISFLPGKLVWVLKLLGIFYVIYITLNILLFVLMPILLPYCFLFLFDKSQHDRLKRVRLMKRQKDKKPKLGDLGNFILHIGPKEEFFVDSRARFVFFLFPYSGDFKNIRVNISFDKINGGLYIVAQNTSAGGKKVLRFQISSRDILCTAKEITFNFGHILGSITIPNPHYICLDDLKRESITFVIKGDDPKINIPFKGKALEAEIVFSCVIMINGRSNFVNEANFANLSGISSSDGSNISIYLNRNQKNYLRKIVVSSVSIHIGDIEIILDNKVIQEIRKQRKK